MRRTRALCLLALPVIASAESDMSAGARRHAAQRLLQREVEVGADGVGVP